MHTITMFTGACLLVTLAVAGAVVSTSGAPIQDYLSFANRAQLHALRRGAADGAGDLLAWVETQSGVANIWGSVHPFDAAHTFQVTQYEDDAAMDVSVFGFYEGRTNGTLVVHFQRAPSDGANPQHLAVPPGSAFFAVPFARASTPVEITKKASVINVDRGQILCATVTDAASAAGGNLGAGTFGMPQMWSQRLSPDGTATDGDPTLLFSSKHGVFGVAAWSPDGSTLAFDNHRGDHGFVGLWRPGAPGAALPRTQGRHRVPVPVLLLRHRAGAKEATGPPPEAGQRGADKEACTLC